MDAMTGPFVQAYFHGTRADLSTGDLIEPGRTSNYGTRRTSNHVYVTSTLDAAVWGAELAAGDGRGRIYVVEATGELEDDPNVTDKRFPGNPTRSYRSREALRVLGEVVGWEGHPPEALQAMTDALAKLAADGVEAIDD